MQFNLSKLRENSKFIWMFKSLLQAKILKFIRHNPQKMKLIFVENLTKTSHKLPCSSGINGNSYILDNKLYKLKKGIKT